MRILWNLSKGILGLIGLYLVMGLATIEWQERRVGLGIGVLVALTIGGLKGLWIAWRARTSAPRDESSPSQ